MHTFPYMIGKGNMSDETDILPESVDALKQEIVDLRKSNTNLLKIVDRNSERKQVLNAEWQIKVLDLQLVIANQTAEALLVTTANKHLQAAVDQLTRVTESHAQSKLANADVQDPVRPICAGPSGDIEMPTRPGNINRKFNGDPKSLTTMKRWTNYAQQQLVRFTPEQLQATVHALDAELSGHKSSLKTTLANLTPGEITDVLPPSYLGAKIRAGQQELADDMQRHWGVNRSLAIKYQYGLSREKYQGLQHKLACDWQDGQWHKREFNGVCYPSLATRWQVDKAVQDIKAKTGLKTFANGLGTQVDLRNLARVNILESVKAGVFYVDETNATIKQAFGADPEFMNVLDSANHHKGMKVTSAGFVLPHGTAHPMAPINTHEHAHIEAGDGNSDMATMGKPVLGGKLCVALFSLRTRTHTPTHTYLCLFPEINKLVSNPVVHMGMYTAHGREVGPEVCSCIWVEVSLCVGPGVYVNMSLCFVYAFVYVCVHVCVHVVFTLCRSRARSTSAPAETW